MTLTPPTLLRLRIVSCHKDEVCTFPYVCVRGIVYIPHNKTKKYNKIDLIMLLKEDDEQQKLECIRESELYYNQGQTFKVISRARFRTLFFKQYPESTSFSIASHVAAG